MKTLFSFTKKEWLEQIRSGRLLLLTILFVLFGIMNPAIAKLTPWLYEARAGELAQSGMSITVGTVSAMDSWIQFFKNIPMALLIFLLLESSIFTKEYQSGTLILALTKGLDRYKVVIAKACVLVILWTVFYWLCFLITFGYNAYFWDNGVALNLMFSVLIPYLFGLWTISLLVLFSTLSKTGTGVLALTGVVVLVSYLIGMFPIIKDYMPTLLLDGNSLIYGLKDSTAYTSAVSVALLSTVLCMTAAIPIFNKKQM